MPRKGDTREPMSAHRRTRAVRPRREERG
jgi:hypothetical protein